MKSPTLSEPNLHEFTCSLEKDSLNEIYYELLDSVFRSSAEKSSNAFNFSYAFSKAIEDLVLSGEEIDRSRTLHVTAKRNMGSVQISLRYQSVFVGVESIGGANNPEVSIQYPVIK